MAEVEQTADIDDGAVDFGDLPGRKRYKIVRDVPIMQEHLLKGDADTPEQYVGPDKLQLIADHNNTRVFETGDATPVVLGHTKDLAPEQKQPPIVGFATNFTVHKLLNKDVQAIHVDFHLKEECLDEIANYPRRSVELWPKRWEIDPIALLGATTPEQDLGLLLLSRPGKPRRYRRIFDEDESMPDEKAKKKQDAGTGGPSVPGASGVAQELIQALQNPEVMKLITSAILETAPFQELLAEGGGEGQPGEPGAEGATGGPPMDAPGGDPPMPGGGDMPGGDAPMGAGPPSGADPESAFYHEGPPERYMGAECDPRDYAMGEGMGGGGYPSATSGFIPGEGGYGMHAPHHYEDYYAASRRHPMHHSYSRDADERYARWLEEQERRRLAGYGPPPAPTPSVLPPEKKKQLQQSDVAVRMSRLEKELGELREQNKKLQRDKVISERTVTLQSLQNEGIELDVSSEIEDVADLSEESFGKHIERIKRSYSRSPVGFKPVQPADKVQMARGGREERMSQEDRAQYQRAIGALQAEAKSRGASMTFEEAKAAVDQSNGVVKIK